MTKPLTCLYRTADGEIIINTDLDEWFAAACKVLKLDHLLKDDSFKDEANRRSPSSDENGKQEQVMGINFPALHSEISARVANEKTEPLVKKILAKGGVADS